MTTAHGREPRATLAERRPVVFSPALRETKRKGPVPTGRSVVVGDSHAYRPIGSVDALPYERDEQVDALILDEAQRILDLRSWRLAGRWLGRYAQTPRGIHVDDVTPTIRVVTGIGAKGMTAGPSVAGESVTALFGG